MKIINRLLILVVIVGGVWFLAKNWNNDTTEPTPSNDAEISEEVNVDGEENTTDQEADREPIKPVEEKKSTVDFEKPTQPATTPTQTTPAATEVVETLEETPVVMSDNATHVRVYLYEWAVDISDKTIPSGPVVFEVTNTGKFTHHFAVDGVQDFGKVIPGATETFTLSLTADEYSLVSPREVDTFHDMSETLFVD